MRRHISKDYKDITLHMSLNEGVSNKNIQCFTGISGRAMERLRKTFRETGGSIRTPICPGRPRILDSLDASVNGALSVLCI